ncbi:MAG: hypothetical protein HXK07_04675 [Actinomyces sp.]|nr:hypothetical protein [Actinomyces sp.]
MRPSRRTLTRVASAAVASLVIVAPISTVSNADALSPTSLPWTTGAGRGTGELTPRKPCRT